jgi:hypothetical protein
MFGFIKNFFGGNSTKPQASQMYDASYPYTTPRVRTIINYNNYNVDFDENVSSADHAVIMSRARDIYSNLGCVYNAINEQVEFSIGDGWQAEFTGEDTAFAATASVWLNNYHTWYLNRELKIATKSVLRDGDILAVYTADDSGTPRVLWVPAHRIGSRDNGTIEEGEYAGHVICNGVIKTKKGKTVAYNILGDADDGSEDQQVSAENSRLVFEQSYPDQTRGISAIAAGIPDLDAYKQIKEFELLAIKHDAHWVAQLVVPPEEIDDVAGEYSDSPYATRQTVSGSRQVTREVMQGGEIALWRTDRGGKLEMLSGNRPGPNTAAFLLDHCLKNAFQAMRYPVEIAYDLNSKGAGTKAAFAKAQRRIDEIQSAIIFPVWQDIIQYIVASAIAKGILPYSKDWYKWRPTYPRDAVLDAHRDIKVDIEMYNRGWTTGTQIASSHGLNWKENIEEKAKELQYVKEIAAKYGINKGELLMLTQQGNAVENPTNAPKEEE